MRRISELVARDVKALKARMPSPPEVAVVLGSGLGPVADRVGGAVVVPFSDLACLPAPTVPGHSGRVLMGTLGGKSAVVFQGRIHLYEGHSRARVIAPTVLAHRLGARVLIVTNAAGSVRADVRPGAFVILSDHLDLADADPTGDHEGLLDGPRFTSLTNAYSPRLRKLAMESAGPFGISVREGVYAMMRGPAYETPAEIRMVKALGGDVVGMSTVPEVIAARNLGMEVLGITTVTNLGAGVEGSVPGHEEVAKVAGDAGPALASWIAAIAETL